jgi:hypothetical protein
VSDVRQRHFPGWNTTNPPGNELQAARFLKRILDKEEIPAQSGMHGNNERISVANIGFGVKGTYDVLRYVQ